MTAVRVERIPVSIGYRTVCAAVGVFILVVSVVIAWNSSYDSLPRVGFFCSAVVSVLVLLRIPFLGFWVDRTSGNLIVRGWFWTRVFPLGSDLKVDRVAYQGALNYGYSRGYFSVISIWTGPDGDEDDGGVLWTLGPSRGVRRDMLRVRAEIAAASSSESDGVRRNPLNSNTKNRRDKQPRS